MFNKTIILEIIYPFRFAIIVSLFKKSPIICNYYIFNFFIFFLYYNKISKIFNYFFFLFFLSSPIRGLLKCVYLKNTYNLTFEIIYTFSYRHCWFFSSSLLIVQTYPYIYIYIYIYRLLKQFQ